MSKPHGPSDEREEEAEIHRVPREPIHSRRHERRGCVGPNRVYGGRSPAEGDDASYRDGRARGDGKDTCDSSPSGHVEGQGRRDSGSGPHQSREHECDDNWWNAKFKSSHD